MYRERDIYIYRERERCVPLRQLPRQTCVDECYRMMLYYNKQYIYIYIYVLYSLNNVLHHVYIYIYI